MPPLKLEGDTLGEKRRHFNKLVKDAIANENYELNRISYNDSDIENLLKIEIANRNRNVDYIIEVMKSNDMLYAATAIKKSTWLITEPQYANIINPEYLHTQLLPSMNTKTFNKLMLHIRLNLKDERRVEAFYEYLNGSDSSEKWLQNCSTPFIENVIKNERLISRSLFIRLCRRSPHFMKYYKRISDCSIHAAKKAILFLLKSHTEEVMNVLKQDTHDYCPEFGKKKTELLMKKSPKTIIDDTEKYIYALDLSVVAKYFDKREIKPFLYKLAKKNFAHYLFYSDRLGHFVKNMLEEERFEFVKKTFIDKTELKEFFPEGENGFFNPNIKSYQWYEFAPFNVALAALKKIIRREPSSSERCAMLSVLMTCAGRNTQHIKILLDFIKDKHMNEPFKFKIQFVNNLLSQVSSHEFDVDNWYILDQLFHSMEVYIESENDVQKCLESIVLYKVLHDEPVPEIVEKKLQFNTFKKVQSNLNLEQKSKLFNYLFNSVLTKLNTENITNESEFSDTTKQLLNALTLLKDWKKDFGKYPIVLNKIQQLINIKQENKWNTDISCLYSVKKSWRKHMFEESLSLCLSEESCLNALKHKPQLLTRYDKEIDTLRTNDAVSLRRLLAKLRVYWPHSLAQHWTDAYSINLNKPTGHAAIITGLFTLLPINKVMDIAKQHIPGDTKVDWGTTDRIEISIMINIAKHLYITRPLIPLDTVLWYAKGDYLQHTVPSLNAILSQLSEVESRKYLPKLLDAPVSLQKFGLNLAVSKLKSEDLKKLFSKIWKTSTNLTIRSILFKHTHNQMCKANNANIQKDLWKVLSTFIDNLTAEESADIYKKIGKVQNVPIGIRAGFFTKSYEFLTSLPASANYEGHVKDLIEYAPRVIDALDEDFIINKMLSPTGTKFCSYGSEFMEIFACYVLCGKSEEDQLLRFRQVVEPEIDKAFQLWDNSRFGNYYIRDNFNKFLSSLSWNFRMYYLSKKTLPVQLFIAIKTKIEKQLPLVENYVLYTSWKLITEYVKIMHEQKSVLNEMFESNTFLTSHYAYRWSSNDMKTIWKDIHFKISPSLGAVIVKYLKDDTEHYNVPTMYSLFNQVFEKLFDDLYFQDQLFILETLRHIIMLYDYDFVPSYCLISMATPKYIFIRNKSKIRSEIRKQLESHPSIEVRMRYYEDFPKPPEVDDASNSE